MDWKRKSNNEYIREGRKRSQWYRIAACLAALTMVCTGYLLIMPAATMEKQDISEQQAERQDSDLSDLAVKTVGLSEDTEGSEWLEKLPEKLTGDWNTDLAATAQSQIGYTESDTDYVVDEDGDICGATLYGEWYGDKYGQWNDMFLSFCLYYAGIPDEAVSWKTEHTELDYLKIFTEIRTYKEMETYSPEIGDVAFYQDGRVGIVSDTGENIRIVSGDADGVVIEDINPELIGFGSLSETENLYNTETSDEIMDAGESGNGQQNEDNLGLQEQPGEVDGSSQEDQTEGTVGSPANGIIDGTSNSPEDQTGSADNSLTDQQATPDNTLDNGTDVQADSAVGRDLEEYVMSRGYGGEAASFIRKLLDANGQEVEPDSDGKYPVYEGESYTFNFRFYAPLGIPEAGTYVYQLPEGITASGIISEEVTADDGTVIGHLSVSEDGTCVILDVIENTKIRLSCNFEVYLTFEKDEEDLPVSSEIKFVTDEEGGESGTVEKYGEINEDGNVEWTITARIPGYSGGTYHSWSINDSINATQAVELYKAEISLTSGTETVKLSAVANTSDEDNIAYFWDNGSKRLYFVSRTGTHENCTGNSLEEMSEEWCTDWYLAEDAVITIKYIDYDHNLEEAGSNVINFVWLHKDESVDSWTYEEKDIPSIIEKSAGSSGRFTITVNPGYVDLSRQETILIRDAMNEHLFYQRGSLEVTATDEDGVQQILTYGTDYTLNVSENMNSLEITILHPGKYKYTITYIVLVESDNADQEYDNTAKVNVFGYEFTAFDNGYGYNAGAEEYTVSVVKTEEDTGEIVPGAEYGLYSSNGELLLTGTTDAEGRISFKGNPSAGVMLASEYLYYLQEIEAPEHYELSDTRYWFYFEDSDQDSINALLEKAEVEGIYREGDEGPVEIVGNGETGNTVKVQDRLIQYELPETGGSGTKMYTIMGIVLIWGATCVLYKKMRDGGKQNEKN